MLFGYEWELLKCPAGAWQWLANNVKEEHLIPDAHHPSKKHRPMMTTADLSLRFFPDYELISRSFLNNPDAFADAFAKAWFKLTHRHMGPQSRYLCKEVPSETFIWQDPIPKCDQPLVSHEGITKLKSAVLGSGLSVIELVSSAWASASTFSGSDKRGGANGARIRFAPQKDWEVNNPAMIQKDLSALEQIQQAFNQSQTDGKKVSLADLIVLGGNEGIEHAANQAGIQIEVPFTPGRMHALESQTDQDSFAVLEPIADGFRNY